MKIGLWISNATLLTVGGGASYISTLLSMIDKYEFGSEVEICYVCIDRALRKKAQERDVVIISQLPPLFYNLFAKFPRISNFLRRIDRDIIRARRLKRVLKGTDIKIMFYIQQMMTLDSTFPSIYINWDIGHRSTFPFPELSDGKSFDIRERFYQKILPKALMVICESKTGKKEIINYTNIGDHKIRIMPLFAGGVTSLRVSEENMNQVLNKYKIEPNHFFYYPAQFWAHKNHVGLIQAFKKYLNEVDNSYKLLFSGADWGNLGYIKDLVRKLGLADDVLFLGFISNDEVYTLYKNATCLVMASHFGPTNMPPIEAMELGCPVACSDLGGHREILANSAAYFDSFDYISIFNALVDVSCHRSEYVHKIFEQSKISVFNSKNAIKKLDEILQEAVIVRSNWA